MFPIYSIKVENQASKSPVHLPPPDADTAECEKAAPDDTEHRNQKEGDKDTLVPIRATMFPNKHASTICSASLILFLGRWLWRSFLFLFQRFIRHSAEFLCRRVFQYLKEAITCLPFCLLHRRNIFCRFRCGECRRSKTE